MHARLGSKLGVGMLLAFTLKGLVSTGVIVLSVLKALGIF